MPAFGKDGIKSVSEVKSRKCYQLVTPEGKAVMASFDRNEAEGRKESLARELKCDLKLVEKEMHLI